jgi:hypothetical protein
MPSHQAAFNIYFSACLAGRHRYGKLCYGMTWKPCTSANPACSLGALVQALGTPCGHRRFKTRSSARRCRPCPCAFEHGLPPLAWPDQRSRPMRTPPTLWGPPCGALGNKFFGGPPLSLEFPLPLTWTSAVRLPETHIYRFPRPTSKFIYWGARIAHPRAYYCGAPALRHILVVAFHPPALPAKCSALRGARRTMQRRLPTPTSPHALCFPSLSRALIHAPLPQRPARMQSSALLTRPGLLSPLPN